MPQQVKRIEKPAASVQHLFLLVCIYYFDVCKGVRHPIQGSKGDALQYKAWGELSF